MGLDDRIGNFEVGKEFDALWVQAEAEDSPFDVFSNDSIDDVIQKFLYLGKLCDLTFQCHNNARDFAIHCEKWRFSAQFENIKQP